MDVTMPDGTVIRGVPDGTPKAEIYAKWKKSTTPGMGEGLLAQFNQGLSLGGADEIVAGAEKLTGGSYDESMARQKSRREAFSQEHPILSGTAVAAGAVAPVVLSTLAGAAFGTPAGGVAAGSASGGRAYQLTRQALGLEGAQAVGRANTVAQGVREGARAAITPGAFTGYLSADPGSRGAGAAMGGTAGAVVGGGIGGGIQLAQNAASRLTPYLSQVADAIGVPKTSGMSFAVPPSGGGGNVTPITRDEAMILAKMEEGGVTPDMAAAALQKARQMGVPLTLADVGGQPVQRLTRGVRTLPGQASAVVDEALATRAKEAPARIVSHLETGFGRKASGNSGATTDALLRQARNESSPFYTRLKTLPPIKDAAVADVFRIPAVQDIVRRSEANAAKFGRNPDPLFDADGNLLREPTFVDVDRVKQNLDELLSPSYNRGPRPADSPGLATREEQGLAKEVRARLVRLADESPNGAVYRAARESYAGPAKARDQYSEGLDITRKDTSLEDIRARRRDNTPSENVWFERGAVEGLRAKVMGVDDLTSQPNTLRQFWGSPESREKLGAAVNPRRRNSLETRLTMENQAAQTNSFVRSGSQTADKASEAMDVASDLVTGGGGPKAILGAAAQKAWERVRVNASEATRERIARHLVNMDPAQQQAFLDRLSRLQKQGQINANQVATVANIVTRQQQTR
jgi:hypothetical protein